MAGRGQTEDRHAIQVVKALLAKATQLVIATDADREGELIAREIIDLCGYRGPIERLWLSALNDASIPHRARCCGPGRDAADVLLGAGALAPTGSWA